MLRWTQLGRRLLSLWFLSAGLSADWAAEAQVPGAPLPGNRSGGAESAAEGVAVLSGGVGLEAQDEMRRAAGAYNLHVLFANPQGAYLAGVAFSVSDPQGRQLVSGTSDGPWLYVKLPPGRYQVTAESHGIRQSRDIQVTSSKPVRLDFRFAD